MAYETSPDSNKSFSNSGDKANKKPFFKKSKSQQFSSETASSIDYKDPDLLSKFISEGGRMLPSRITNISAKYQRALKKAIKHSRTLALLPFVYTSK